MLRSVKEGTQLARILKFREFELAPSTFEPRRGVRVIKLEKLATELLLLLVSQRESVVSRETIAEKLWGKDVFVDSEDGINTAVRKVRKALGDNSERPRFVQRVPGRGYRFIAPVAESFAMRPRIGYCSWSCPSLVLETARQRITLATE